MTLPASAKMFIILTFVLGGFFNTNNAAAAKTPPKKVAAPDAMELRRLDLEERKLTLEREKLNHEKEKDAEDFNLEKQKAWWSAISIPLSIFVPLILGVGAYWVQTRLQRKSEASQHQLKKNDGILQFKLKAAEIAMNARDANEVKTKANMLKVLFGRELKDFKPNNFDPTDHPFSRSIEMRESLISLLAENPNSRKQILRAWEIVFPWDADPDWKNKLPAGKKYPWLAELKKEYGDETITGSEDA